MPGTTIRYFSRQDLKPDSEIDEATARTLSSYARVSLDGDRKLQQEYWADSRLWSVCYFEVQDRRRRFIAHRSRYPDVSCDFIDLFDDAAGYCWEIASRWQTEEGSGRRIVTLIDSQGDPIGEWTLSGDDGLRETQKHVWRDSAIRFTFEYGRRGEVGPGFDHLEGESVELDVVKPTEPDEEYWAHGLALPQDMANPVFPFEKLEAIRKRLGPN